MFNWVKELYIVKLLFGTEEKKENVTPVITPLVSNQPVDKPKKPGRRPGIKTSKKKAVK